MGGVEVPSRLAPSGRSRTLFHTIASSWALWFLMAMAVTTMARAESSSPPNIHAVIVSSSRYWFNYRHAMNALGLYRILQQNGIPDSQIVLMIADEYATNPRNPYKNGMYANGIRPDETWYSENTELDYRGSDVTVQNFFNAVLGTGPKSLRNTDQDSHLLIFVTGHGGDQFFKFQDEEELTAQDIANLMNELALRQKFRKALFIADTCQAFTLFDKVTTPNVYALGTSLRDENAYAHHSDRHLGLSVIERWTHGFLKQYSKRPVHPVTTTLHDLMVEPFREKTALGAHVGVLGDFRDLLLKDFFGSPPMKRKARKFGEEDNKPKVLPVVSTDLPTVISFKKAVAENFVKIPNTSMPELELESTSPYEPNDGNFGLMLGFLVILVVSASLFGRSKDNEDETR